MPESTAVYQNRELSWLKFNKRVLEEAADEALPLMERLTFAAIWSGNLDEFLRVRAGALMERKLRDDAQTDNKTLMHPSEQLAALFNEIKKYLPMKDSVTAQIERSLAEKGVRRYSYDRLTPAMRQRADDLFDYSVKPFANTYVLSDADSFPFIETGRIYAALRLANAQGSFTAVVSDNAEHERILTFDEGGFGYILAEDIVLARADSLFEGYSVTEKALFRVSRSAAVTLDDEPNITSDRLEAMSMVLAKRKIMPPVRLQIFGSCSELLSDILAETLGAEKNAVFFELTPFEMKYVFKLRELLSDRSELFYPKFSPVTPEYISEKEPMCSQIAKQDILLSFPYESIEPFLRMLDEAADDPTVSSVKMTLYRVAEDSRVINALCRAARNGRQVTVCTELRARFDEQRNIDCSKQLIDAGCRVIHGIPFIKVHSKLCLITRIVNGQPQYVTQIGTGNYNERTSLQYADFSLMTADADIARDADRVFTELENGMTVSVTNSLLVSPQRLRLPLAAMIDDEKRLAESGGEAYIGLKMNGLTDKLLIDRLIAASQAGVKIDLIVRGVCCLTPGIPGQTENIRIISIVGRYLEHSRLYIFGRGERQAVYISSADLMTRNTSRRVEAAVKISDPGIKSRLTEYFEIQLKDDTTARVMLPDGSYERLHGGTLDCQKYFAEKALEKVMTQVTQKFTPEVTPNVTREFTPKVTTDITPEITQEVTQEVTSGSTTGSATQETLPAVIEPENTAIAESGPEPVTETEPEQQPEKQSLFRRIINFFKRKKKK